MPEAPAAPPPPAPASTPAAPAAPPPGTTEHEPSPGEFMAAEIADFDAMDAGRPAPSDKPRDEKGKFTPSPQGKPAAPVKPPAKPEVEPKPPKDETTPPEGGTKPPEDATPKPVKAADLRNAYDGLKKKVREELEPEVQRLRAKVQEYETKGGEAPGPILEKIKTLESRNAELEKHIALVDYEKSQEFTTKYDQPYRELWGKAVRAFSQLAVKEPEIDEEGQVVGHKARPATEADLIKLGSLPLSELDEAAQTMFGASAPRAIAYIEKLRDLAESRQTALEEAKGKAETWNAQRTLEFQNRQKTLATAWTDINTSLKTKFPRAFVPEEGNADDAAAHLKGFALADLLFLGATALSPEQMEVLPPTFRDTVKAGKPLSEVQKVQLHALARLKMSNHDRLLARVKARDAKIAELEKALAEYEDSQPSTRRAGTAGKAPDLSPEQQVEAELRAMDK